MQGPLEEQFIIIINVIHIIGLVGDNILLEAIFDMQLDKFYWSFGDGEETLMNLCNVVYHTWTEPGLYNVIVEGKTPQGSGILTVSFNQGKIFVPIA